VANPAYTYGFFSFNDNINYFVTERPYSITPFQQTFFKVARLEGQKKTGETVNERIIQVKMKVIGASRIDLEQKLEVMYAALSLRQQQLVIHASDARYFVADCTNIECALQGGLPISATATLTFTCQQPYALATVASTFTTGNVMLSASGTNWVLPVQQFAGGGSTFSRPQITITNQSTVAWSSVSILQQTDSQQIVINDSLPTTVGDRIDIYCDPNMPTNGYTVQLNQSGTLIGFVGVFPVLEYLTTSWLITIAAPSAPTISATWTWTPRYMA